MVLFYIKDIRLKSGVLRPLNYCTTIHNAVTLFVMKDIHLKSADLSPSNYFTTIYNVVLFYIKYIHLKI